MSKVDTTWITGRDYDSTYILNIAYWNTQNAMLSQYHRSLDPFVVYASFREREDLAFCIGKL